MLVSRSESVLSVSMVAGSILANASSVGANTVNSLPFRVSTRFTLGLSWPDSAWVSVVSIGLLDAATVTGSCAMPVTEPGPVGTCSAYAAQPVPTRFAAGSAIALVVGAAAEVEVISATVELVVAASDAESFEHAAAPNTATAAQPGSRNSLPENRLHCCLTPLSRTSLYSRPDNQTLGIRSEAGHGWAEFLRVTFASHWAFWRRLRPPVPRRGTMGQ